jgi:hypothetical protein
MKIEVKAVLSDGTIIIRRLDDEPMPTEGCQYTIYFEKVESDPDPEFNQ